MAAVLDDLVRMLALERIEENLFRGETQDLGWGTVFGGHVLGQALSAAAQTVPSDRRVHSMHAYFLRPGDVSRPIVYDVDRIRDGTSFTTRRVVAIQSGQAIFNLAASFHKDEAGFDHQAAMPEAPAPLGLDTEPERFAKLVERLPRLAALRTQADRPIEVRIAEPEEDPIHPAAREPRRMVWLRAVAPLPDDPALHAYLLAYASDFSFVTTSLLPHGVTWFTPGMQVASIDHVMWFHRPARIDDWLLYAMESPSAHGARGFVRGAIFASDGRLVASTAQEGLIRQREPRAP